MSDPHTAPPAPQQQPVAAGQSPWASQVVGAPPAAWGHPVAPPQQPPPGPIRARWVVLGVGLGLALIGLVATLGIVAAWRQGASPTIASTSAHKSDLRDYVVPAPAGSRPWSSQPSDEELDLAAASGLAADGAVESRRSMLSHWGFVRGYARRWRTHAAVVQVVLYQFKNVADATGFARDDLAASAHDDNSSDPGGDWTAPTPIDGTDNGVAMLLAKPYSTGDSATLGVARAADVVVTVLSVMAPPADVKAGNEVMVAQIHRL